MLDFYSETPRRAFIESDFVNYPSGFKCMINHTLELQNDVCEAAIAEFAAFQRSLRSRVSQQFADRIKEIRDNALLWAEDGNTTVKALLREILEQTDHMLHEIEAADKAELSLLEFLDIKAGELSRILSEQKEKSAWQLKRLRRPTF
jgi:hypothetical protein